MKNIFFLNLFLLVFFLQKSALTSDTTVLIWDANEECYGHAAIQSKTYHMSFWPDGNVKDIGVLEAHNRGMRGSLVCHHDIDVALEGQRKPTLYKLDKVSNFKIEQAYEEMLDYNNITPDNVTIEESENKLELYNEGKINTTPEYSTSRSLWTTSGLFHGRKEYYKFAQSCTSFSLSILKRGDYKYDESELFQDTQDIWQGIVGAITIRSFENTIKNNLNPRPIILNKDKGKCNIF